MPYFSIIIPLYNKENFISDTLKSVFSQSFSDFEIIIVNDGFQFRFKYLAHDSLLLLYSFLCDIYLYYYMAHLRIHTLNQK